MKNIDSLAKEITLDGLRFDPSVPFGAKILYAEIKGKVKKDGKCHYKPEIIAEIYKVSEQTVRKWIKILVKKHLIKLSLDYEDSKGKQVQFIEIIF